MEKISAVIITFNEESCISRCIRSLQPVADEIIVLDSFSEDDTAKVAKSEGVLVIQKSFEGYKEQKNAALELASFNYILSLDADETLSVELIHSILLAKEKFTHQAYFMNRSNIYCGKYIRHGLWYPDKKIRLFDKRYAYWGGLNPHDKIFLTESKKATKLKGDILHYSYNSIVDHKKRNQELSSIAAQSLFDAGVRNTGLKIYTSPLWRFVKGYFLKLGFLDGRLGYVIAKNIASQAYLKYKKLKMLGKQKKRSYPGSVCDSRGNSLTESTSKCFFS